MAIFTEDTLLSAMETAGADEMPDEVERKGLGTPATRAGIIELGGGEEQERLTQHGAHQQPDPLAEQGGIEGSGCAGADVTLR